MPNKYERKTAGFLPELAPATQEGKQLVITQLEADLAKAIITAGNNGLYPVAVVDALLNVAAILGVYGYGDVEAAINFKPTDEPALPEIEKITAAVPKIHSLLKSLGGMPKDTFHSFKNISMQLMRDIAAMVARGALDGKPCNNPDCPIHGKNAHVHNPVDGGSFGPDLSNAIVVNGAGTAEARELLERLFPGLPKPGNLKDIN